MDVQGSVSAASLHGLAADPALAVPWTSFGAAPSAARSSFLRKAMKSAAKSDIYCELQNYANHRNLERNLHLGVTPLGILV
jgi:hypothetical protein